MTFAVNGICFKDQEHQQLYYALCALMEQVNDLDEYHQAAAYLFSLDNVCREHYKDLFDFEGDRIKPGGIAEEWQTSTSLKTSRLMFNLWNGYTTEEESKDYTPESLFACSYAPYYWQAIKLRYPCYAEP